MKKVLLLGSGGQLGTAIKKIFAAGDIAVTPFTRAEFDADRDGPAERLTDLADYDYLVNCIAFHKVDRCEDDFKQSFKINGQLVLALSHLCRASDVCLVHISTDYVFDGSKKQPYREDDLPSPLNVYGASKLAGETFVRAHCPKHFVLRISSLFGDKPQRVAEVNFVEKMIQAARENRPLKVIDNQIMSPTYTEDVAGAIMTIIESGSEDYGLYHACNSGDCSWYDYARTIFRLTGLTNELTPISYSEYHSRARRPQYCSMDNAKLANIHRMRPWTEALEDYLKQKGYLKGV